MTCAKHDLSFDDCPDCVAAREPRFWVVLADGTLLDDLTEEQYIDYAESGVTIDGGQS